MNASGSRAQLAYISESTYGTTPSSPIFKVLPDSRNSIGLEKETFTSERIRSDRQIADLRHGVRSVAGDITFELCSSNYDDFLQAVLMGTWATAQIAATGVMKITTQPTATNTMTIGTVTYTFVSIGDFDTAGEIAIGTSVADTRARIVKAIRGLDGVNTRHPTVNITAFNGTDATVTARTKGTGGNSIVTTDTLAQAGDGFAVGTLTGGANSSSKSELKVGTVRRSFTVETLFADIVKYVRSTGVELNTMSLEVTPGAMVTGSFGTLGHDSQTDTAIVAGATYTPAPITHIYDGFTGAMRVDGIEVAVVTAISLNLENGIENLQVVGKNSTVQGGAGRSTVTGEITAFMEDLTFIKMFDEESSFSVEFSLAGVGSAYNYTFTLPRCKFTGGKPEVGDEREISISFPFSALLDSDESSQLIITRS